VHQSFLLLAAVTALSVAGQGSACAQTDDSLLKPFEMDHRAASRSPADVSFLHDAPAGKDGFIRIQNGHFVTPKGGRIRFWGVHLTDWSRGSVELPSREDIPMYASTLARYGVNMVRLHFLDLDAPRGIIDSRRNDSRGFDAGQLDRLDYLISELKKRGIYCDLNLNVGRSYKEGDGVADFAKIRWGKGLVLFDKRLIELQKEHARNLLTHVNPYTKTEYRNEPAIAIVEILNENALGIGFNAMTPFYETELAGLYNDWLRKKLTPEQMQKLRAATGVTAEEPVPRLKGPEVRSAPKDRYDVEIAFFTEMENNFYQDMSAYLKKELGVKAPITATADHSHNGSSYPMLLSTTKLDIVDGHVYWQHPGARETPSPMVNDPNWSTVVQLSRTAVAGKPYTVSETNHPFPNPWAAEGIPIISAYASFQDWDAVILYTFEPKRDPEWQPYMGDPYDISLDPIKMPELAAGALLFLRGDVRAASEMVERTYTREQALDSLRLPPAERPYFTPGFPPYLPLVHGVRIKSFDGPPTGKFDVKLTDPIVSDTGQLSWYTSPERTGLVTVDSDRSQALVGFIKQNGKPVKNMSADIDNTFASLVLSSLDGRPLARAERMLLVAGARSANTGMKWDEKHLSATNTGGPPSLIEPVTGTVTLRDLRGARAVSATALDGAGKPLGAPIEAKKAAGGWTLPVGQPVTTWYVVTVRR
jgi:hypothetical protein